MHNSNHCNALFKNAVHMVLLSFTAQNAVKYKHSLLNDSKQTATTRHTCTYTWLCLWTWLSDTMTIIITTPTNTAKTFRRHQDHPSENPQNLGNVLHSSNVSVTVPLCLVKLCLCSIIMYYSGKLCWCSIIMYYSGLSDCRPARLRPPGCSIQSRLNQHNHHRHHHSVFIVYFFLFHSLIYSTIQNYINVKNHASRFRVLFIWMWDASDNDDMGLENQLRQSSSSSLLFWS